MGSGSGGIGSCAWGLAKGVLARVNGGEVVLWLQGFLGWGFWQQQDGGPRNMPVTVVIVGALQHNVNGQHMPTRMPCVADTVLYRHLLLLSYACVVAAYCLYCLLHPPQLNYFAQALRVAATAAQGAVHVCPHSLGVVCAMLERKPHGMIHESTPVCSCLDSTDRQAHVETGVTRKKRVKQHTAQPVAAQRATASRSLHAPLSRRQLEPSTAVTQVLLGTRESNQQPAPLETLSCVRAVLQKYGKAANAAKNLQRVHSHSCSMSSHAHTTHLQKLSERR